MTDHAEKLKEIVEKCGWRDDDDQACSYSGDERLLFPTMMRIATAQQAELVRLREENARLTEFQEKALEDAHHVQANYLSPYEVDGLLNSIFAKFRESDETRLQETYSHREEAEKWKREGDMYGWNFHEGVSSGCTQASIIFFRVQRLIEDIAKSKNVKLDRPATPGATHER